MRRAIRFLTVLALADKAEAISSTLAKTETNELNMLKLDRMAKENQEFKTKIDTMSAAIIEVEGRNDALRLSAARVSSDIKHVRDQLLELKDSYRLAQGYADKEVREAMESDDQVAGVLKELSDEDAKVAADADTQQKIQSITAKGANAEHRLSYTGFPAHVLLQTEASVKAKHFPVYFPENADESASFGFEPISLLDLEQEARMKQETDYHERLGLLMRSRESLLQQEKAVSTCYMGVVREKMQLTETVERLTKKYGALKVMLNTLRAYGKLVGTSDSSIGLSLLQTDATLQKPHTSNLHHQAADQRQLFSFEQLTENAAKSYASIESEANALRANVADFQQGLQETFAGIRDHCKRDLQKQHSVNMDIAQSNAYSAEVMKSLGHEIRNLQRMAGKVQEDVELATDRLRELTDNVTTGRDYVDRALAESRDRLRTGNSLKALAKLDQKFNQEVKQRANKKAWKRMTSISDDQTSLLQFDKQARTDVSEKMLTDLVAKLKTLNARGEKERQNLMQLCQTGIDQGLDQHAALSKEQTSIKQQLQTRSNLKERLAVAVQQLKTSLKTIKQRYRSLALFAKAIGDRSMKGYEQKTGRPVSMLQWTPPPAAETSG